MSILFSYHSFERLVIVFFICLILINIIKKHTFIFFHIIFFSVKIILFAIYFLTNEIIMLQNISKKKQRTIIWLQF